MRQFGEHAVGCRGSRAALLTRFPIIETGNLDYRTRDFVALVARVDIEGAAVDVYVTSVHVAG